MDLCIEQMMEVFREDQSVKPRSRSNTDRLQMLCHEYTAGTGSQQYHAMNLLF